MLVEIPSRLFQVKTVSITRRFKSSPDPAAIGKIVARRLNSEGSCEQPDSGHDSGKVARKWPDGAKPTKNPKAFQLRDSLKTNMVRATGLEPEQGCPH
jgi:hypothetical protein